MFIDSFLFILSEIYFCTLTYSEFSGARLQPQIILGNEKVARVGHSAHMSPLGLLRSLKGLILISTGASGWPSEYLQVDRVAEIQSLTVYFLDQLPISIT